PRSSATLTNRAPQFRARPIQSLSNRQHLQVRKPTSAPLRKLLNQVMILDERQSSKPSNKARSKSSYLNRYPLSGTKDRSRSRFRRNRFQHATNPCPRLRCRSNCHRRLLREANAGKSNHVFTSAALKSRSIIIPLQFPRGPYARHPCKTIR